MIAFTSYNVKFSARLYPENFVVNFILLSTIRICKKKIDTCILGMNNLNCYFFYPQHHYYVKYLTVFMYIFLYPYLTCAHIRTQQMPVFTNDFYKKKKAFIFY